MKKDVLITVTGLLFMGKGDREEDYVDIILPGKYYRRGEKHFLLFEEQVEGSTLPIKNRMTLEPGRAEMKRSGFVNTDMVFLPKQGTRTWYMTPFGEIEMDIYTTQITMAEKEDELRADIRYRLILGGEEMDCFVKILAQSRGTA